MDKFQADCAACKLSSAIIGEMFEKINEGFNNQIELRDTEIEELKEKVKDQQKIIGELTNHEHLKDYQDDNKQEAIDELKEENKKLKEFISQSVEDSINKYGVCGNIALQESHKKEIENLETEIRRLKSRKLYKQLRKENAELREKI